MIFSNKRKEKDTKGIRFSISQKFLTKFQASFVPLFVYYISERFQISRKCVKVRNPSKTNSQFFTCTNLIKITKEYYNEFFGQRKKEHENRFIDEPIVSR